MENNSAVTKRSQPPCKKRKGRTGRGWTKKRTFIKDPYERSRKNSDKIDSLAKTLNEWFELTHTPGLFLAFSDGQIRFHGNSEAMMSFCRDKEVVEKFTYYLRTQKTFGEELYNEYEVKSNWKERDVKWKRKCIRDIIVFEFSSNHIKWDESKKPNWWPNQVGFKNPSGKEAYGKDTCDLVISSFIEKGNACFELEGDEEHLEDQPSFLGEVESIHKLKNSNFDPDVIKQMTDDFESLNAKIDILHACRDEIEKLQAASFNERSVQLSEIDYKHRKFTEYPYEPVKIKGDGNCLYRATSKALFGEDEKWSLLKFGSLLTICTNPKDLLEELKTTYGDVTFDIVGEIWNNDTDGEVKLLSRCSEMSKEGAYGGILEIIGLSRFCNSKITICIASNLPLFQYLNGDYDFGLKSWGYIRLMVTGVDAPNHFVPLLLCSHHTQETFGDRQCWAQYHCRVSLGETFVCENCHFRYHCYCVSEFLTGEIKTCGCDRSTYVSSNLSWLHSISSASECLATINNDKLKAFVTKIIHKNRQLKSNRLQVFYRSIMSNSFNQDTRWNTSIKKEVLQILKDFVLSLNFDVSHFGRSQNSIEKLINHVLVPEVVVYVSEHKDPGIANRLMVERFVEDQIFL